MATLQTDELNSQEFDAAEYIRNYFKPMEISDERKKVREEAAEDFRDVLLFLFALISAYSDYGTIDWIAIEEELRVELESAATKYARDSQALKNYVAVKASDFVSVTKEHNLNDGYWTSDERATMEAVNEANDVVGYEEWQKAIDDGFTYKVWKTENDRRVRKTHIRVEGKKIPIRDMFEVGDGFMRYPHDWYYNPKECYNCRCACIYVGKNNNEEETGHRSEHALESTTRVAVSALDKDIMRRRIDNLGEDVSTSREISNRANEILLHRDGTHFEDLAYVDTVKHKSKINKDYDYYDGKKSQCKPNTPMNRMLNEAEKRTIIGLHNHPSSGAPSYADIKAAYERKYKYGLVFAHNGNIFKYSVKDNAKIFGASKLTIENRLAQYEKAFYNGDIENMNAEKKTLSMYGVDVEVLP